MLIHGAIIPPRAVLEAVTAVVQSVPTPVPDATTSSSATKGMLGRFGRRKDGGGPADEPQAAPVLDYVPVERQQLPITGFGNLTTSDAHRLVDVIATAAAQWAPATVRFAGGTALDFPGDWSVWAKLDGDVDGAMAVARGVMQSVESLGFFVDRRAFRPMLSVATVTPSTTGPYLQAVVDALDAFRGEKWTVEISLTKETFVAGRTEMAEFQRIGPG